MNTLEANIRNTKSKGDVRSLRLNGNVPAIIYGGKEQNEKIVEILESLEELDDVQNIYTNASLGNTK